MLLGFIAETAGHERRPEASGVLVMCRYGYTAVVPEIEASTIYDPGLIDQTSLRPRDTAQSETRKLLGITS